jgi:alkylation response protein AidB-like acyl-CoA dehydrogenase
MIMETTTHQQVIIEEAREFADREIRPFASVFEENEGIPGKLIGKMAARGYLAASFPKEYGGLGLDPLHYGLFTEVIGKACASTRAVLTVHTSLVGETILRWGTAEQKKRWLPDMANGNIIAAFALSEPGTGADAGSVKTSYAKDGDHFIINGNKKWITLSGIAGLFLVIAASNSTITAFMVNRNSPGITTYPIKGLLAGRAAYISEIEFKNVRVPKENMLGKEGTGFSFIVNTALDAGRYSIAWGGLGIAQEALEAMVTYARKRKQFGKKIHTFQLIQGMIADAVATIAAGRALCIHAGRLRTEKHNDAIVETTIAKYYTSKMANHVTADAVQVHGGNGCYSKYPVERLFREAKILEIIEGTSQVLQEVIAEYGLQKFYISAGTAELNIQ